MALFLTCALSLPGPVYGLRPMGKEGAGLEEDLRHRLTAGLEEPVGEIAGELGRLADEEARLIQRKDWAGLSDHQDQVIRRIEAIPERLRKTGQVRPWINLLETDRVVLLANRRLPKEWTPGDPIRDRDGLDKDIYEALDLSDKILKRKPKAALRRTIRLQQAQAVATLSGAGLLSSPEVIRGAVTDRKDRQVPLGYSFLLLSNGFRAHHDRLSADSDSSEGNASYVKGLAFALMAALSSPKEFPLEDWGRLYSFSPLLDYIPLEVRTAHRKEDLAGILQKVLQERFRRQPVDPSLREDLLLTSVPPAVFEAAGLAGRALADLLIRIGEMELAVEFLQTVVGPTEGHLEENRQTAYRSYPRDRLIFNGLPDLEHGEVLAGPLGAAATMDWLTAQLPRFMPDPAIRGDEVRVALRIPHGLDGEAPFPIQKGWEKLLRDELNSHEGSSFWVLLREHPREPRLVLTVTNIKPAPPLLKQDQPPVLVTNGGPADATQAVAEKLTSLLHQEAEAVGKRDWSQFRRIETQVRRTVIQEVSRDRLTDPAIREPLVLLEMNQRMYLTLPPGWRIGMELTPRKADRLRKAMEYGREWLEPEELPLSLPTKRQILLNLAWLSTALQVAGHLTDDEEDAAAMVDLRLPLGSLLSLYSEAYRNRSLVHIRQKDREGSDDSYVKAMATALGAALAPESEFFDPSQKATVPLDRLLEFLPKGMRQLMEGAGFAPEEQRAILRLLLDVTLRPHHPVDSIFLEEILFPGATQGALLMEMGSHAARLLGTFVIHAQEAALARNLNGEFKRETDALSQGFFERGKRLEKGLQRPEYLGYEWRFTFTLPTSAGLEEREPVSVPETPDPRWQKAHQKIEQALLNHPGGPLGVLELAELAGVGVATLYRHQFREIAERVNAQRLKAKRPAVILDSAAAIEQALLNHPGGPLGVSELADLAGVSTFALYRHQFREIAERVNAQRRKAKRPAVELPKEQEHTEDPAAAIEQALLNHPGGPLGVYELADLAGVSRQTLYDHRFREIAERVNAQRPAGKRILLGGRGSAPAAGLEELEAKRDLTVKGEPFEAEQKRVSLSGRGVPDAVSGGPGRSAGLPPPAAGQTFHKSARFPSGSLLRFQPPDRDSRRQVKGQSDQKNSRPEGATDESANHQPTEYDRRRPADQADKIFPTLRSQSRESTHPDNKFTTPVASFQQEPPIAAGGSAPLTAGLEELEIRWSRDLSEEDRQALGIPPGREAIVVTQPEEVRLPETAQILAHADLTAYLIGKVPEETEVLGLMHPSATVSLAAAQENARQLLADPDHPVGEKDLVILHSKYVPAGEEGEWVPSIMRVPVLNLSEAVVRELSPDRLALLRILSLQLKRPVAIDQAEFDKELRGRRVLVLYV
ncbi:MAG: hypothetical protein HYZ93_06785 [Candidatus Omnitrophica bacterium]|nr:hypothetical protein [Candidatus Omnitrophota bacterium]